MDYEPIYCAEQIVVHPDLADVLKNYTKEVIRRQPDDLLEFSAFYFSNLANITTDTQHHEAISLEQICRIYSAVLHSGALRTCDIAFLQDQALALGISAAKFEQVCAFAGYGMDSSVDPEDFCMLLITTMTSDLRAILTAIFEVFGDGGTIALEHFLDLFGILAKYDPQRWSSDLLESLGQDLEGRSAISYNSVIDLPCITSRL